MCKKSILQAIGIMALLSLHVSAAGAVAETEFPETVTLNEYLRYAALHNAGLEAAFNRWKAALERLPQARALPDPKFNYTYFIEEVETRVGPQEQKFGLVQMFPWFGKLRLREDMAAQAAEAARQNYEKTKLSLFYRVQKAYYEYWYLAQAISVTKEHIRLVTNIESVARTRFKTGSAPHSAVVQIQVELGKLDDRLQSLESLRAPTVAALNAALDRSPHLTLPWPHSLPRTDAIFSDEEAMQRLAETNPDLRRLDHLIEAEKAGIELAGKDFYPDIALGVDYIQTDEALMPDTPDSGKDPVMAMVSVNLPLWRGKYRAAEREALLRRDAVEKDRDDAAKRLQAELQLALYHFRDAERKIDLYGDTLLPKAEESLQVAQQGFEAGSITFISLIDAQRLLLEFQLAHERAKADQGQRLAEIEMLTGRKIGGRATTAEHQEMENQEQ